MELTPRPNRSLNPSAPPHPQGQQGARSTGPVHIKIDPDNGTLTVKQRNLARGLKRLAIVLLLIVLGGYSAYSFFIGNTGLLTGHSAAAPDSNAVDTSKTLPPDELERQEEAALGKEQLKKVLDLGQSIRASCNTLDDELRRWDMEVQPLWTNDTGRLIASDNGSALAFEAQTKEHRPTTADADALRTRLGDLLTPVQRAWDAQQWSYRPALN